MQTVDGKLLLCIRFTCSRWLTRWRRQPDYLRRTSRRVGGWGGAAKRRRRGLLETTKNDDNAIAALTINGSAACRGDRIAATFLSNTAAGSTDGARCAARASSNACGTVLRSSRTRMVSAARWRRRYRGRFQPEGPPRPHGPSSIPSPTMANGALRPQLFDDVDLAVGQHVGDDVVDAGLVGDGLGGDGVSRHRRRAQASIVQRATALAAESLTTSATEIASRTLIVHHDEHHGLTP